MLREDPILLQSFLREVDELSEDEFLARHDHPFLVMQTVELSRLKTEIEAALPHEHKACALWAEVAPMTTSESNTTVIVCLGLRPKHGLSFDRMILGRAPEADIVVLDETVSKFHLEFSWDVLRERCVVTDLDSRNGTRIEEQAIAAGANARITSGASLNFGTLQTRFFTPRAFLSWLRNRAVSGFEFNSLIGLDSEQSAGVGKHSEASGNGATRY